PPARSTARRKRSSTRTARPTRSRSTRRRSSRPSGSCWRSARTASCYGSARPPAPATATAASPFTPPSNLPPPPPLRFPLVVTLPPARAKLIGELQVFGGRQYRPLLHVRDVATAILPHIESG